MLWLALHFPNLPIEIFNPDQDSPFVVLQDNRIYQRNTAAKNQNLALGSTLATAHSIYPMLKHTHRNPEAEQKRLHTLADTLYRFSSYVSVQIPDCVLLEIGSSLKLFGSHASVTEEAVALCATLDHIAVGRVASTPWAAIALARSGHHKLADVPLTDAGLELAGVQDSAVERFANMGIFTLGPLLELPSKALGKRFGKSMLRYLDQLTGNAPDPREASHPAATFEQALHLLQPIADKGDLFNHAQSPMPKLATALQQWLITHQLGCEQLQWQFASHHREKSCVQVKFAKGKQNASDFMRVSQLQLEQTELPAEVLSVALRAQRLLPWAGASQSLFKSLHLAGTKTGEMSEIIDEFNARLGDGSCRGLQTLTQHTPESAWAALPAHRLAKQNRAEAPDFLQQLTKRPLWLFDPPRRVRRDELELLQGPERIQAQWWVPETTCRDYYIAQHRLGAECWAFVDPQEQWYLHGYFG